MTDRFALILGALLAATVAADLFANGGEVLLFLFRKLVQLTDYLIFWH